MSTKNSLHCIVDDTALITNIEEIEGWIQKGLVSLIIPLHTLERLHLLKKDTSQIGVNARKAVKFLDQITSSDDLPNDAVIIQGPEDQYGTWQEVEVHYLEQQKDQKGGETQLHPVIGQVESQSSLAHHGTKHEIKPDNPETVMEKLSLGKSGKHQSPQLTPPISPAASDLASTKTSPDIQDSRLSEQDASPVPPTLKPLINPVVWYIHEKKNKLPDVEIIFLTNSGDTAMIVKEFGVSPKTIHQLRQIIGQEEVERENHDKYNRKHGARPVTPKSANAEPRTLFRYEDASSEDDEVVFKPKGRGVPRTPISGRVASPTQKHTRKTSGQSPSTSMSVPATDKPQIPTEQIDPDSFDRGGFARGSIPLANVGSPYTNFTRGNSRGNHTPTGPRGSGQRGGDARGGRSGRARGRLFVP